MQATDFHARCLKVLDEVQATGEPVIVTKRGKAVVKIVRVDSAGDDIFGSMKGKFEIRGDIESPIEDWKFSKTHRARTSTRGRK